MRVSVFVGVSIDGFLAREDGSLDHLKPFEGEEHGYDDFMRGVDALVIGRATYDTVLGFDAWPYGGKRVIVLTHRAIAPRHGEASYAGDLRTLMTRLSAEGVQHVYLDGGVAVRQGLEEGLVDEMTISMVPVTLGAGRPLFGGASNTTEWELINLSKYPSGVAQSRYRRKR